MYRCRVVFKPDRDIVIREVTESSPPVCPGMFVGGVLIPFDVLNYALYVFGRFRGESIRPLGYIVGDELVERCIGRLDGKRDMNDDLLITQGRVSELHDVAGL